jgi:hypothetical protein
MDQWLVAEQSNPVKHSEIQFMSPLSSAILKRWFQVFLFVCGVSLLYSAIVDISIVRTYGVARHYIFKFEMMVEIDPTSVGEPSVSHSAPIYSIWSCSEKDASSTPRPSPQSPVETTPKYSPLPPPPPPYRWS